MSALGDDLTRAKRLAADARALEAASAAAFKTLTEIRGLDAECGDLIAVALSARADELARVAALYVAAAAIFRRVEAGISAAVDAETRSPEQH